ncbi:methyl-accepting chemotaxis protein [Pseudonocardia sp. RS11V-5]|uniref:CHASE3 domain-containing protein n=1 Tax=Pseudonocardia terrae TaxID=2905831 RepID=UPI001E47FC29|nr:CHASE3 domain-containing protein [Pseudonocardia terrae]MCE3551481.1 methyl-accepting chemotaxis protein [Pseudonocardia terrae]
MQALVLVVLVALFGLLAVAVVNMAQATTADGVMMERLGPALTSVERLQSAYVDQETGLRGYVLTGQEGFLEPYTAASPRIAAEQRALGTEVPELADDLKAVVAAHDGWTTDAARPFIDLRRAGDVAQASALAAQGVGKNRFDVLRQRVDTLRTQISAEAGAAAADAEAARRRLVGVLVAVALLGVALGIVAVRLQRRWVLAPLTRLGDDVAAVAAGDHDHPIRDDGLRELATVGRGVATMRDRLTDHAAETARTERLRARADQAERMADTLRNEVILELSSLALTLTALAGRHPGAEAELRRVVHRLDRAITAIRTAIFGSPDPAPPPR